MPGARDTLENGLRIMPGADPIHRHPKPTHVIFCCFDALDMTLNQHLGIPTAYRERFEPRWA
jgi:hypothetical protein